MALVKSSIADPLGYPTSPHAAFLPGSVSPWRFRSFRVREISLRGVGSFPQPSLRAIHCTVKRRTGHVHFFVMLPIVYGVSPAKRRAV